MVTWHLILNHTQLKASGHTVNNAMRSVFFVILSLLQNLGEYINNIYIYIYIHIF